MNQIIKSFLSDHKKEYDIETYDDKPAFEHFINRCVITRYAIERFDPFDVMTDDGEIGLDGVAIIINNQLVSTKDECKLIYAQGVTIDVTFVFIQSKTSDSFDGGEMSTFTKGVKHFFEDEKTRPQTNEKMENLIHIKDYIYSQSINHDIKPALALYYVCCGKWNEGNNLTNTIKQDKKHFDDTQDFSSVQYFSYDNEKIITMYKEMRRKIQKTFIMEKRMPFFAMNGIKESYFGLIKCTDLVDMLTDEQGNLFSNIFEDNVRDFQGYNPVNTEIQATITDKNAQNRFAVLNNGITIIAKDIRTEGDEIKIFDYQIVNGCQTSRVLFDNRSKISSNSFILAKIIRVENDDILDDIVYTSNRQTEVKYEAFTSANRFHKMLQEYYNSIEQPYRLYYERRSKQYDMDSSINKNKIVSLAGQTKAYISMFLNEPHSIHRYYGEILQAYKKRIYGSDDNPEPYFISAYYYYLIDLAIKKNFIDKKWKDYKYHLCYAIRCLSVGTSIVRGNSREIKKFTETLFNIIKNTDDFNRILNTACSCLDNTLKISSDISDDLLCRSKEFTNRVTDIIKNYLNDTTNKEFLQKGDIVSCQVTAIRPKNLEVILKTDDDRKNGSIHISQITGKYINNISDVINIGEFLQAKILNEKFDDYPFGWSLSLLID